MAINVVNNTIILDNEDTDINQLHQHFIRNNSKLINKSDKKYTIDCNIILQNKSKLHCENTNIVCLGTMFRITGDSTLQLGKLVDDITSDGCTLFLPNVRDKYAFGSELKCNGANLLAYDSHIVANCHWGFESSNNIVKLIDCVVEGYGNINGIESVIRNITIENFNTRQGIFNTIGLVSEYNNVHIKNVLPVTGVYDELKDIRDVIDDMSSNVRKLLIGLGKDIKLNTTVINKNNGVQLKI